MIWYKILFGFCLLLLCVSYAVLLAAQRRGDKHQARVLHIFRLGLSLSAISYFLRITATPQGGAPSFLVLLTCLAGTALIWLGWLEHWKLRVEGPHAPRVLPGDEEEPVTEPLHPLPNGLLPPLAAHTCQVLSHAQCEAERLHDCCMDTDHLLFGLLRHRRSAGAQILDGLGIDPEKVHLELLSQMASRRTFAEKLPLDTTRRSGTESSALTEEALQVFVLAAQEAHRFEETRVGTEHLLLGLVLAGKGKAASVLFGQGITVEGIRRAILKEKRPASSKRL